MGPHCSTVVLSLVGRGPVTALTSACNEAPSQVGRFEFGDGVLCSKTPIVVPVAALTSARNGAPSRVSRVLVRVMVSCHRTDLSVQWGPITVRFC